MIKVALNTICKPSSSIKWAEYDSAREFHYIDLTSVDRNTDSIIDPQIITAKNAPSRAQRIVYTDDVLFATTRPTLRRKCITPPQYNGQICSTGFCVLRPQIDKVLPKWVYYMLSADQFYDYIEPLQKGASYPAITDNEVRSFEIPLPAIAEQQRIVALLDNEFEKIDKLRSNAELNLQHAKDLFQAALAKELEPKEGWVKEKVECLCDILDKYRKPISKRDRKVGIYPYYGASCVQDYVDDFIFDGRYLLIGEDGAKWGSGDNTAYIVEGKFWVNNHAHIVKCKENVIDTYLLYYFIFYDFTEKVAGAIIPKLTQETLRNLEVPVPQYAEQQQIVATLDGLNAKCGVLQENYTKTIALCDDLKQSLLRKAFNGEL